MTEKWPPALDQGKTIGVIFIDFQKAFDCVSHQTLALKLKASGIYGNAYDWIIHYLSNRRQFVMINSCKSDVTKVDTGVPQGSLLGPSLYNIHVYSNDLPMTSAANVEMFADDSAAFIIDKSVDSILNQIQIALNSLNT